MIKNQGLMSMCLLETSIWVQNRRPSVDDTNRNLQLEVRRQGKKGSISVMSEVYILCNRKWKKMQWPNQGLNLGPSQY